MTLSLWLRYLFLLFLGLLLPFIAYKIYEGYQEEIYIQQHSPTLKIPVVGRIKAWETIKNPNKIYLRYQGKRYSLPWWNRYFRQTAQSDSFCVHYDQLRDRAVLSDVHPKPPYVLLVLIGFVGLIVTGATIIDLRSSN